MRKSQRLVLKLFHNVQEQKTSNMKKSKHKMNTIGCNTIITSSWIWFQSKRFPLERKNYLISFLLKAPRQ